MQNNFIFLMTLFEMEYKEVKKEVIFIYSGYSWTDFFSGHDLQIGKRAEGTLINF